jgi:hypothetical protein
MASLNSESHLLRDRSTDTAFEIGLRSGCRGRRGGLDEWRTLFCLFVLVARAAPENEEAGDDGQDFGDVAHRRLTVGVLEKGLPVPAGHYALAEALT